MYFVYIYIVYIMHALSPPYLLTSNTLSPLNFYKYLITQLGMTLGLLAASLGQMGD